MTTYQSSTWPWFWPIRWRPCLSLRVVLVAPLVLQLLVVVGLVGYMSFRASSEAVETLTTRLTSEVADGLSRYLRQLGVVGVDISLEDLKDFLASLPIAEDGLVMVVDEQGRLLASSRQADDPYLAAQQRPVLPQLSQVDDPLVREAATLLATPWDGGLQSLAVAGQHYFLHQQRFEHHQGPVWTTVVMVPAASFMGGIVHNLHWAVGLGVVVLLVTLVAGSFSARWIVAPIQSLNQAARQLGQTDFAAPLPLQRGDEVGELSRSFHRMAAQLHTAFDSLRQDQQRLHQFLEAMPVGVAIHRVDDGLYYVNRLGRRILGAEDLAALDRHHAAWAGPLSQALAGQRAVSDEVEIQRADGLVPLQVTATPVFAQNGGVEYAICAFLDITLRKQTEHVLTHYNQHLEEEIHKRTEALEREIRERRQTETFLRTSQTQLRSLATMLPGCTFSFVMQPDRSSYFEFVSPGVEDLLEVPLNRFIHGFEDILRSQLHPEDRLAFFRAFHHSLCTLSRFQHEWRMTTPSGKQRWLQVTSQPQRRDSGAICWHGIVLDISSRKQAEEALRTANDELRRLATVDGLTQVANRRYFDDRLTREWKRQLRAAKPLGLLLFDVDFFKLFNDHYGHPRGDDCLVQIAATARGVVHRAGDLVARYGGEEFAVILPDTDLDGAMAVAEQLREAVADLAIGHDPSPIAGRITVSVGVASLVPCRRQTMAELIEQADKALYLAKQQGRNRCQVYQSMGRACGGMDWRG